MIDDYIQEVLQEVLREIDRQIIEELFALSNKARKLCICKTQTLMAHGCQCGGI